jgi:HEAT repeats
MRWFASLGLAVVVLIVTATDSSAQWFGTKKAKTPPQQRVPELIVALKSEKDYHKRADAAEELRQFDSKEFPEIIAALIEALQTDSAIGVRIEAATGLGRLRPISVPAGQALEKAASDDASFRVRFQANLSLGYYKLSGYHTPKKNEPQGPVINGRTDEPPLAGGGEPWWQNGSASSKSPLPGAPNISRPLPAGPAHNTQVPVETISNPLIQQAPQQGPAIPAPSPPLPQLPLQWTPIPGEGPRLLPPDKG